MRVSLLPGLALVALLATLPANAGWMLAAGPTRSDGAALELSRLTPRWDLALGYVSAQQVDVNVNQDTCYAQPIGLPACVTESWREEQDTDDYLYLSVQRRYALPRLGPARPVFGLGLVGQTDTNAYVSSPVSFSLSLGFNLGERASGQDMLLLRWQF